MLFLILLFSTASGPDALALPDRNSPDRAEALVDLGIAYYKAGKYPEAVDSYQQALRVDPEFPGVYARLGAAYIILGEYPKAVDAFRQAIRLAPGDAETHFALGIACLLNGDRDAAIAEYIVLKGLDRERAAGLLELLY